MSSVSSILLALAATAVCIAANPWGHGSDWHAPTHYASHGSHGSGYGAGHAVGDDWADKHGSVWGADNAHVEGDAAGYAKGQKSDWANYQYGGEGARAEGDAWAKGYGNSFGDGHDSGAAAGGHAGHGAAHGNGWAGHDVYGHGDLHHGHHGVYHPY